MERLGKVENPIVIKISHLGNKILPINGLDQEFPLTKDNDGLVLGEGSNHFGFVIISDYNNDRKENFYYTDYEISGIATYGNDIHIYERDKRSPWIFGSNGKLVQANKPTIDYHVKVESFLIDGSIKKFSPETVTLVFESNSKPNYIEYKGEQFSETNGIVFGQEIYGIRLKNMVTGEEKKIATEEALYGIEISDGYKTGFVVYENGKYHPWKIDGKGIILEESSYNPYSRRDQDYYYKKYNKELKLTKETEEN